MNRGAGMAWVAILFLTLFGCAPVVEQSGEEPPPIVEQEVAPGGLSLPATFTGSIPCANCLRVDIVMNLRADMLYQLRKTYITRQGAQKVESQMRNWRYSSDGGMIILGKQKGMMKTYVVADNNTLVFLDLESERETKPINYTLSRAPGYDPFRDNVKIRGMFSARNGGASLTECSSGASFSVARAGAYEETVKEYLRLPHNPGEPVLLSFEGALQGSQIGRYGGSIIINDFKRFYLNRRCQVQRVNASLTDTVWTLNSIGDRQAASYDYNSAPYLIMRRDNSLEGFGGCNAITGRYLVRGDVLLVERTSQTRMACFAGNELENRLLELLDETEFFKIEGEVLQLLDLDGEVMATFTGI